MSIHVTSTRPADLTSLHDCIDTIARNEDFLAFDVAPPEEELGRHVEACSTNGSLHLVAKDGLRVVGWAQIDRARGDSVAHRGHLGMGVLPEYRGRGIARQLLERCISIANARGIYRIELEARTDNRRALELYSSMGFSVEAIVKDAMKTDGIFYDTFKMCLRIFPPSQSTPRTALHAGAAY